MGEIVLDASAVLAMVFVEPGGERVRSELLAQAHSIAMSAVNVCEVMTRLRRENYILTAEKAAALLPGVEIVQFDMNEAASAAVLHGSGSPLSLGDRACLALAQRLGATAWTTDKIWAGMAHGVAVEVLR